MKDKLIIILKKFWASMKFPLLSIFVAFIIGAFFIIWTGNSPLVAYRALIDGNFGSMSKFGSMLLKTTPLLLTGLSVAFAFRSGLFNIGAEGQYMLGAISTIAVAFLMLDAPRIILIPSLILAGAIGGALWGFIPGILKAKRGVHEVIITIMLNYISINLSNYLVRTTFNNETVTGEYKAHTFLLPENARLIKLNQIFSFFGNSSVHTGIFIALIVAILSYFILFKSVLGYEIRSCGNNKDAAECGGIKTARTMVIAMSLSGAFAGLAGALQITGLTGKVDIVPVSPGYGFTGIAVALIGKNHPIGVIGGALLFGFLDNGARKMQIEGIPKEVVGIIQGVIIVFIAGEQIIKYFPAIKNWFKSLIKKGGHNHV